MTNDAGGVSYAASVAAVLVFVIAFSGTVEHFLTGGARAS